MKKQNKGAQSPKEVRAMSKDYQIQNYMYNQECIDKITDGYRKKHDSLYVKPSSKSVPKFRKVLVQQSLEEF